MYKLPNNVTREKLLQFVGKEGTLLNPVQDTDGNWVVSEEEWNSPEFEYLKTQYPELAAQFTEIEFNPIIIEQPPF